MNNMFADENKPGTVVNVAEKSKQAYGKALEDLQAFTCEQVHV